MARLLWAGSPSQTSDGFLTAHVPLEVVEEGNQTFGVVAALAGLEEQAAAASVPAVADRRADRHLRPVESMNQDRCFALRSPGSADGGTLRDAAFVLEEDPSLLGRPLHLVLSGPHRLTL